MTAAIRTLVADDSTMLRNMVRLVIANIPALELAGEAHDGREVVEQSIRLTPDLVIIDIQMPRMNGLDATRLIKRQPHAPRVIVLSFNEDRADHEAAIQAGADEFCGKSRMQDDLPAAIVRLFPEAGFARS
jgi:DNA-binding NarL/FixJ family response regulator